MLIIANLMIIIIAAAVVVVVVVVVPGVAADQFGEANDPPPDYGVPAAECAEIARALGPYADPPFPTLGCCSDQRVTCNVDGRIVAYDLTHGALGMPKPNPGFTQYPPILSFVTSIRIAAPYRYKFDNSTGTPFGGWSPYPPNPDPRDCRSDCNLVAYNFDNMVEITWFPFEISNVPTIPLDLGWFSLLSPFKSLEVLNIDVLAPADNSNSWLYRITPIQTLKSLTLSGSSRAIVLGDMGPLSTAGDFTSLTFLNITRQGISGTLESIMNTNISSTLETLILIDCPAILGTIGALANFKNLKTIHIENTNVGGDLADFAKGNLVNTLESLSIINNLNVHGRIENLGYLRQLKNVDIEKTSLIGGVSFLATPDGRTPLPNLITSASQITLKGCFFDKGVVAGSVYTPEFQNIPGVTFCTQGQTMSFDTGAFQFVKSDSAVLSGAATPGTSEKSSAPNAIPTSVAVGKQNSTSGAGDSGRNGIAPGGVPLRINNSSAFTTTTASSGNATASGNSADGGGFNKVFVVIISAVVLLVIIGVVAVVFVILHNRRKGMKESFVVVSTGAPTKTSHVTNIPESSRRTSAPPYVEPSSGQPLENENWNYSMERHPGTIRNGPMTSMADISSEAVPMNTQATTPHTPASDEKRMLAAASQMETARWAAGAPNTAAQDPPVSKPIMDWTVEDVRAWTTDSGLSIQITKCLMAGAVDGRRLCGLSREDIVKLGVPDAFARTLHFMVEELMKS